MFVRTASIWYEQIFDTGLYSTVSFILTIIPRSFLTVLLKKVSSFLTFCDTSKDEESVAQSHAHKSKKT